MSGRFKYLRQNILMRGVASAALVLTLVGRAAPVVAAEADGSVKAAPAEDASPSSEAGSPLGLWRVEAMLDQACRNLVQRYNLSPEQEKYTRALMTRRVKAFLGDHETELRSLLTEWFKAQISGKADAAMAQRWARAAIPVFDDAEKAIFAGNKSWRKILTTEQKAIHDADLAGMEVTFGTLRERFSRWEKGGFDRVADGFGRRRARPRGKTARAGQADPARVSRTVGTPYRRPGAEHYWDAYVRKFIEDHNLDDSQQQSALAILQECKERATNYRQAHADETAKAQQKLRELASPGSDSQARIAAQTALRTLSKPITEIFGEMRARLDGIPTEAQKAARKKRLAARREEQLARLRERMKKRKTALSRIHVTSVPTRTQPTKRPAAGTSATKPTAATAKNAAVPTAQEK